jgi:hypothetical protein
VGQDVGIGLIVVALPFFLFGLWLRSWRAPLYVMVFWLALCVLWLVSEATTGPGDDHADGSLGINVFSGGFFTLAVVLAALTMLATSLGVVVARLGAQRHEN